ncbi:hypothetical protein NC652_034880 [Populus alba x Populus x berolinensis]|nr:hypothetical protein NC652_034880 [Populus alba x Populus x berolinensis]
MNVEVLKHCATVLFLESSLPDAFPENHWVSPNAITRSHRNGKSPVLNKNSPSSSSHCCRRSQYSVVSNTAHPDTFDMVALGNEVNAASFQPDVAMEENPILQPPEMPSTVTVPESCGGVLGFLELDEHFLSRSFEGVIESNYFTRGAILQLRCPRLRIRFGLSRPRLSFVVDASPSLCYVLETCESIVRKVYEDSDCSSDWRSAVTRKPGFVNNPTVRLNIPYCTKWDVAQYATDMYKKEPSGTTQELIFSQFDATELDTWFRPGTFVDAYLSLDPYDDPADFWHAISGIKKFSSIMSGMHHLFETFVLTFVMKSLVQFYVWSTRQVIWELINVVVLVAHDFYITLHSQYSWSNIDSVKTCASITGYLFKDKTMIILN